MDRINFENNFNKSLQIQDIQYEDEGDYMCYIKGQQIERRFQLVVEGLSLS